MGGSVGTAVVDRQGVRVERVRRRAERNDQGVVRDTQPVGGVEIVDRLTNEVDDCGKRLQMLLAEGRGSLPVAIGVEGKVPPPERNRVDVTVWGGISGNDRLDEIDFDPSNLHRSSAWFR